MVIQTDSILNHCFYEEKSQIFREIMEIWLFNFQHTSVLKAEPPQRISNILIFLYVNYQSVHIGSKLEPGITGSGWTVSCSSSTLINMEMSGNEMNIFSAPRQLCFNVHLQLTVIPGDIQKIIPEKTKMIHTRDDALQDRLILSWKHRFNDSTVWDHGKSKVHLR